MDVQAINLPHNLQLIVNLSMKRRLKKASSSAPIFIKTLLFHSIRPHAEFEYLSIRKIRYALVIPNIFSKKKPGQAGRVLKIAVVLFQK